MNESEIFFSAIFTGACLASVFCYFWKNRYSVIDHAMIALANTALAAFLCVALNNLYLMNFWQLALVTFLFSLIKWDWIMSIQDK